ncbi:hypothetical protein HCX48_07990 [Rhodocyclus tenuis]|uniref:Flagellar protein FliT n=2 Tax=Rhodocyclus TaxID=1064 RepID=A0A6L5JZC7_RHOTE|nr:flagellar protein FliT [Rhodocyclus gracilis]MQY51578.1 hypothetical protein [Rhodocyclus gracilis]MRD73060.1 hypothetical protein [Rhodocyclus gracilis]NJA89162.1 hypothetical protein [Rhodocyclus gracilis]
MSTATPLLRTLRDIHHLMLEHAKTLDWEAAAADWATAEPGFAALARSPLAQLPLAERQEAALLVRELLDLQQRFSDLALPWLEQVRPLLESFARSAAEPSDAVATS